MHWTLTVIGLAVAWALLGGLWRPGSIALAASWMAGQAFYVGTGNALPLALYAVLDPLVLYIIWRHHSSRLDWFIMACFPFQWATYVMVTGAAQWWILWITSLAQMVLAGPWPAMQRMLPLVSHGPLRTRNRA